MITVGLSGAFSIHGDSIPLPDHLFHDAAASIVVDGRVKFALEEERVSRMKKTNWFPEGALRKGLEQCELTLDSVDRLAYYFPASVIDGYMNDVYYQKNDIARRYAQDLIADRLNGLGLGQVVSDKIEFCDHHLTHAVATATASGFDHSLVAVFDGTGGLDSATMYRQSGQQLTSLGSYSTSQSLGFLYTFITHLLGYQFGDEYKVMGLAPYGDPHRYEWLFNSFGSLLPKGQYELNVLQARASLLGHGFVPRQASEPLTQQHKDIAAAMQRYLESRILHSLQYWRGETFESRLCFSGGVAHNSTLNGRILREAGFSDVFVHPASHDGGASLGAALAAAARGGDVLDRTRIRRCDYGSDLPAESILIRELEKWQEFVQWSISDHPERDAAQMLADGKIIGWVQGRSEFGPRALGNRSILADPRPAENRDRVNRVVKYREGYRPFAPAVIEEAAEHYFDLPDVKTSYEFMSYVVGVKSAARTELQAVTHVDSSARLQVVTRESNSRFYSLIKHFGDIVGTPVVLNTSLNNSSEPMVDSVSDTLQCLMTTGLDAVVIGSAIVTARPFSTAQLQNCGWLLAREVELLTVDKLRGEKEYFLNRSYLHSYPSRQRITASLAHFLSNERASDENEDFSGELFDCWKRRLVELQF